MSRQRRKHKERRRRVRRDKRAKDSADTGESPGQVEPESPNAVAITPEPASERAVPGSRTGPVTARGPATTALLLGGLCLAYVFVSDLGEFLLTLYLDSPTLEYLEKLLARHWRETSYGVPFMARYLAVGAALSGVLYLCLLGGSRRLALAVLAFVIWGAVLFFFTRGALYAVLRVGLSGDLAAYVVENNALLLEAPGAASGRIPAALWAYLLLLLPPVLLFLSPLRWTGPTRAERVETRWHHALATFAVFVLAAIVGLGAESFAARLRPAEPVADTSPSPAGPTELPPLSVVTPELYPYQNAFRERYGFALGPNTDVVVLMLESSRAAYVPLEKTRYFRPEDRDVIAVDDFFVPIPHSSNTHFSFFTGMHSARNARHAYDRIVLERSLPGMLARRGYKTHYIYGGPIKFDREDQMLDALGMGITDMRDFERRRDENGRRLYKKFWWGVDDRALVDEARAILQRESGPLFLTLAFTNSHHSYFVAHPDRYNEFDNNTDVGRHRNAIQYGLDLSDEVVDLFREHGRGDALFIVVSDHGESFGEYGFIMHDFSLYNTEVRVPFVMRHPDFRRLFDRPRFPAGSVLDVYPTLADLFDSPFTGKIHGRSLFAPDYSPRLLLRSWNTNDYAGLIDGQTKWLYAHPRRELLRMNRRDGDVTSVPLDASARAFVEAMRSQRFGDKDEPDEDEESAADDAAKQESGEADTGVLGAESAGVAPVVEDDPVDTP